MPFPYRLLKSSELKRLEEILVQYCRQWAEDWAGHSGCRASVWRAEEFDQGTLGNELDDWQWSLSAEGEAIATINGTAVAASLTQVLLRSEIRMSKPTALSMELGQSIFTDLRSGFLKAHGLESQPISTIGESTKEFLNRFRTTGGGSVIAAISMAGFELILALNAMLVQKIIQGSASHFGEGRKLDSRLSAISAKKLPIRVVLGEVVMELADLATIAVGDVITLDVPVTRPMQVETVEGKRLCGAYLGTQAGSKAVQLTK